MGEQSKSKVHAPYNFVPFSEKVLLRYAGPEELPRHDQIDPALKSGEIHVTMTADTPVFVSDGRDNFFRAPNGQYALPGSTIRGMVRQNMQILGFGCVHPGEDFEDVQIYFREMAAARGSAGGALKAYYQAALGVETRKVDRGRSVSVPTKVRAGYLRSTGRGYVIQPVRGTYLRVSRKHPDAAAQPPVSLPPGGRGQTGGGTVRPGRAVLSGGLGEPEKCAGPGKLLGLAPSGGGEARLLPPP